MILLTTLLLLSNMVLIAFICFQEEIRSRLGGKK